MEEFAELYESLYQDLYRIAYYYMGDAAEAEDAVGEAVLKAYEHFNRLKDKEAFRSWMIRILVNTCKRRMRRWYRKEEEIADNSVSYEEDFSGRMQVEKWLSVLSKEERLIVVLTVFGGYKGEEIAGILHKNHSTIRSKYRRARNKLRKEVEWDEFRTGKQKKEGGMV